MAQNVAWESSLAKVRTDIFQRESVKQKEWCAKSRAQRNILEGIY